MNLPRFIFGAFRAHGLPRGTLEAMMAIDLKTTLARIGGPSQATLYRWMADGQFPRPVRIGPRKVAWDEAEVDEWWANRRAERDSEDRG